VSFQWDFPAILVNNVKAGTGKPSTNQAHAIPGRGGVMLKPLTRAVERVRARFNSLEAELELNRMLLVQGRISDYKHQTLPSITDAEFRVFSQWGEDGIIQYLLSKVPIAKTVFVEFGVDNYKESNTRFLLINNNWTGFLIVCDKNNLEKIRSQDYYWRYDLTAVCAFITKDNINDIIAHAGINGDIGLLSVDLDGNDYWIWEAITVISPRIVIAEYNSVFGDRLPVTVPYDDYFNRTKAHYSNLYFGASLPALCKLARQRGYIFVGSNSAGCNAFFVRRDVAIDLAEVMCRDGYVESKARESRDPQGSLTFISGRQRLELIKHKTLFDVETGRTSRIEELSLYY
jgi:hypothetical protein